MFPPSCSGRDLLKELEMQPATIPAVLLAIALLVTCWAAPGLLAAASAADEPARAVAATEVGGELLPALRTWSDRIADTAIQAGELLAAGYRRAPVLVLALCALLILPAAALLSFGVQAAARRKMKRAAGRAAHLRAGTVEVSREEPNDTAPLWPHQAWLTLQDGAAGTLPLAGQTIRIGRHQDNDVRLPDTSVHRYHAVIEQTPEEEFVITDLSGTDGNGLRVNGERLARAQLADGDIIELGRTRLKFESVPV
jgi:hypothetical protein